MATTAERVEQQVIFCHTGAKQALLGHVLRDPAIKRVLVFTPPSTGPTGSCAASSKAGIAGAAIHGNKSQPQRERALAAFPRRLLPGAGGDRHRRPRHRRRRRDPRRQLRPAERAGELRPPHRPHRARRGRGAGHLVLQRRGAGLLARHRADHPPEGAGGRLPRGLRGSVASGGRRDRGRRGAAPAPPAAGPSGQRQATVAPVAVAVRKPAAALAPAVSRVATSGPSRARTAAAASPTVATDRAVRSSRVRTVPRGRRSAPPRRPAGPAPGSPSRSTSGPPRRRGRTGDRLARPLAALLNLPKFIRAGHRSGPMLLGDGDAVRTLPGCRRGVALAPAVQNGNVHRRFSRGYVRREDCEHAISLVKRSGDASTVDMTTKIA